MLTFCIVNGGCSGKFNIAASLKAVCMRNRIHPGKSQQTIQIADIIVTIK